MGESFASDCLFESLKCLDIVLVDTLAVRFEERDVFDDLLLGVLPCSNSNVPFQLDQVVRDLEHITPGGLVVGAVHILELLGF